MKAVGVLLVLTLLWGASPKEPITPLPRHMPYHKQKARLGQKLFFDPRLSADGTVACANCHVLESGGDDNLKVSVGIGGKRGNVNAPTVYNAVFNFRQFWDGRAKDLRQQAQGPIENPVEMGNRFEALVALLRRIPEYRRMFEMVYPDGITKANITDAIAEYEKTLITPDAPFDRFLRGDKEALSDKAKRGYALFKIKGCVICHNGVNIGGNLYGKFGIYEDVNTTNAGKFSWSGRKQDIGVFKVPSLRNVALTAPYMHDGRYETLEDAVKFMAHFQLGKTLEDDEVDAIVAFLKSLTGKQHRRDERL